MIAILAILIAITTASFVYLVLDLLVGKEVHESSMIQRRLRRLLIPEQPTIARSEAQISGIWSIDQIFRRQQIIKNLHDLLIFSGWTMPLMVFVIGDLIWTGIVYFFVRIISHSTLGAAVAAIIAGLIPYWVLVVNKRRYIDKTTLFLPDALMMMRNALKAGQSIQSAFQVVAHEAPRPVSTEFARVVREIELGSHMGEALNALSERVPTKDIRMFVLGVFIQQEIGGNLAELFANLESTIRDRISLRRELRTLSAQGKLSGVILMLLPPVVAAILWFMNQTYFTPLIENEAGRMVLYIALALQIIGALIIRKLTSISIAT